MKDRSRRKGKTGRNVGGISGASMAPSLTPSITVAIERSSRKCTAAFPRARKEPEGESRHVRVTIVASCLRLRPRGSFGQHGGLKWA